MDKMAPTMQRAEGTASTKTVMGKSLKSPKNRKKAMNLEHHEMKGNVLR